MTRFEEATLNRVLRLNRAPGLLRRAVARSAVRKGLGAAALSASPHDPYVLLDLGLYRSAAQTADPVARMIGLAGLGEIDTAAALFEHCGEIGAAQRIRLAKAAAATSAQFALDVLPAKAHAERAACLVALGRPDDAEMHFGKVASAAERHVLAAAAHGWRGEHRGVRDEISQLFALHGLHAPYPISDDPVSIFNTQAPAAPSLSGTPLVSVVIAVRDAQDTISVALQSFVGQSWANLEVLVVDDGSSDRTAAVVHQWQARDPRIKLIRNVRNAGAYGARNSGIAAAAGEWVVFHDADDWAHPNRIERHISQAASSAASVCRYLRITDNGRIVNPRVFPLLRYNPIFMAVRREVLLRAGPFDLVQTGGDSELLARLEAQVGRWNVRRNRECLVLARWQAGSLMASNETGLSRTGLAARVGYVEDWRRRHAAAFVAAGLSSAC